MRTTRMAGAGLLAGGLASAALLLAPDHLGALHPGAMIPGHEGLACTSCHEPAPGTMRQQLQAKLRHWIGWRMSTAAFGFEAPDSGDCLACHARPDDRHPVHRFMEPRFARARREVGAQACQGCHREHRGARVTAGGRFCVACHDDLTLKNDPSDVPHAALVAEARWDTCLGCHDFHGNHARQVQTRLDDAHTLSAVEAYLARGGDPYGATKTHAARSSRP